MLVAPAQRLLEVVHPHEHHGRRNLLADEAKEPLGAR